MTARPLSTTMISLTVFGLAAIGLVSYLWLSVLPDLQVRRQAIDNDRTTISLLEQQQSNLTSLRRDLDDLRQQQTTLDENIWVFDKEDEFFRLWNDLAAAHGVTIDQPQAADITPDGTILARPLTVMIHGTFSAVMDTLQDIQRYKPALAINAVTLTPATASTITATIGIDTLWR